MQSGQAVGEALQRTAGQARRRLDGYASEMGALDQKINELVARRGKALLDLAKHYLPNMDEATIEGTFVEVRDDLLEVLARKQRRKTEIERRIDRDRGDLARLEAELAKVTAELNEKVAQREALEETVADRLHSSDEFNALSQRALEAEQQLENNEQRVAEIKAEANRKLPSYENSRLFTYLYRQGYGTAAYQATGWSRAIDRWVARLIDFNHARRGYTFLRVTPQLMDQEVTRRRDQFNALMEQVEAIEDRVSDELGLTDVMREGQRIGSQRDKLVADAAQRQEALAQFREQLLKLEQPDNEFYEQAVARLQNFLANLRQGQLESRSRATPQREDDAIVAEIAWLRDQLSGVDQHAQTLRSERQLWDRRLAELQQVIQRFREAEFDSRRSEFGRQLDVDQALAHFLDGNLAADQLWSTLRKNQKFAPARNQTHDVSRVLDSDFSHLLGRVLIEVAGQAMRGAAYRSTQRRAPVRQQRRQSAGRPTFGKRGFTNGRGF